MYTARRRMSINGKIFMPGEVVPEAEKLKKFRTLLSAGWLLGPKFVKQMVSSPLAPSASADSAPAVDSVFIQIQANQAFMVTSKEVEPNVVDVQREPGVEPTGRVEVPNRRQESGGSALAGRRARLHS